MLISERVFSADGFPRVDLVFALSLSAVNPTTHDLMKNISKAVIQRFGIDRIRYALVLFGDTVVGQFDFNSILLEQKSIIDAVQKVLKVDSSQSPNVKAAMDRAKLLFEQGPQTDNVRRVLVVLIDKTASNTAQDLEMSKRELQNQRVTIIPVPIGDQLDITTLYNTTVFQDHVTPINASDVPGIAAEEIMSKIPRK